MNRCRHGWQAFFFVLILAVLSIGVWAQPAPLVKKLDPPNWWTHFTPEVTLLVTGENLSGVRVESLTTGVKVEGSHSSANGHDCFVHLKLEGGLQAGNAEVRLHNASGATTIPFPVLARNDAPTDSQGFSRDDVIYLIMPDRFADGNPANDQPAGSTGIYDRSKPMAYHGGDLRGIREHLGYLHDLGVTTLWLTPVVKNTDSDYHGYHAVDFYAIDDHMGSLADYQGMVADAHKLGMKVLMDFSPITPARGIPGQMIHRLRLGCMDRPHTILILPIPLLGWLTRMLRRVSHARPWKAGLPGSCRI